MATSIFNKYSNEDVIAIIVHSVVSYFPLYAKTLLWLFIGIVTYARYVRFFGMSATVDWIWGGRGFFLFCRFLWKFYTIRLDAIILISSGLQRFQRSNIFHYESILYERESIISISHKQRTVWDKIFDTGDIVIMMEESMSVIYNHVHQPQDMVAKISSMKVAYDKTKYTPEKPKGPAIDEEKFTALVNTLGEVIVSYLDKK